MQDRTWTLKLVDGRTYEGLSEEDATAALARLIYGIEPAQQRRAAIAPVVNGHEMPLAA